MIIEIIFLILFGFSFLMSINITNSDFEIPFLNALFILLNGFAFFILIAGVLMSFWVFISQVINWKIDVLNPISPLIAIYNEQGIVNFLTASFMYANVYFWLFYGLGKLKFNSIKDESLSRKGTKKREAQIERKKNAYFYILGNFIIGFIIILFLNAKYSWMLN